MLGGWPGGAADSRRPCPHPVLCCAQLDFVFANVVMAIVADFMLVWLPAPTFSLR